MTRKTNVRQHIRRLPTGRKTGVVRHTRRVKGGMKMTGDTPQFDAMKKLKQKGTIFSFDNPKIENEFRDSELEDRTSLKVKGWKLLRRNPFVWEKGDKLVQVSF